MLPLFCPDEGILYQLLTLYQRRSRCVDLPTVSYGSMMTRGLHHHLWSGIPDRELCAVGYVLAPQCVTLHPRGFCVVRIVGQCSAPQCVVTHTEGLAFPCCFGLAHPHRIWPFFANTLSWTLSPSVTCQPRVFVN